MTEELKETTKKVGSKVKETGGERNLSVVPRNKTSGEKLILPNPEVIINGDILYINEVNEKTGEVSMKKAGRKLVITQTNRALEDKTVSFDLEIYTKDGVVIEEGISRSILTNKEELFKTVEKGSDVNNNNYKIYWKSLANQDEMIRNSSMSHKNLGWDIYEGEKIYKHENIISKNPINSIYNGDLIIESKGSLAEYCKFLTDEVIGHTPLEAAIALGLSAVIVGGVDGYRTNIFNIFGNSTTGKTTTGELIISLASKPTVEENGLMTSWQATQNAIMGKVRHNNGLPVLIDDSSLSKIKDFGNIIYGLESGRDKERLNKESELRETATWNNTIISTGEASLLEGANENEGLKVRLYEFGGVVWTSSSDHSERIKKKVQEVYGHGVKVVAEDLLQLSDEEISSRLIAFEDSGREYLKKYKRINNLTDRMLRIYGSVMIGIDIFEKRVKLGFDLVAIEKFLLDNMFKDQRLMWEIALERLKGYVEKNIKRFGRDVIYDLGRQEVKIDMEAKSYSDLLGRIKDKKIRTEKDRETKEERKIIEREIAILEDEFYRIMKELGFTNPKGILKNFKENDILNAEKDRYTRERKVSEHGNPVKVVVIKIEAEYSEMQEAKDEYHRRYKRDEDIKDSTREKKTKEETQRVLDEVDKHFEEADKEDQEIEDLEEAKTEGNLGEIVANLEFPDI